MCATFARGSPRPPPADFALRELPVNSGPTSWWRCARTGRPAIDWDRRAGSRFSAPHLPWGVWYLGSSKATCFWEVFGEDLLDRFEDDRTVPRTEHDARQWIEVTLPRGLRIVDLTQSDVLRKIGADGATFLADYASIKPWSLALMRHPTQIDGLLYGSRLDVGTKCLALFDRTFTAGGKSKPGSGFKRLLRARVVQTLWQDAWLHRYLARENIAVDAPPE